jgi:hypothetical protein
MDEQARFENALAWIRFAPIERQMLIEASGCVSVAMIVLLSPEQISCIFKRLKAGD